MELLTNALITYCRVTGNPIPEIVWFKDGVSVENNPDYRTTFDNGICRLTIEETFVDDSAVYVCCGTNSVGSAETSAVLTVIGKYWITLELFSLFVVYVIFFYGL